MSLQQSYLGVTPQPALMSYSECTVPVGLPASTVQPIPARGIPPAASTTEQLPPPPPPPPLSPPPHAPKALPPEKSKKLQKGSKVST